MTPPRPPLRPQIVRLRLQDRTRDLKNAGPEPRGRTECRLASE